MLKQLVYVSSAVHPFSDEELLQILRVSGQKSKPLGITGALLHWDGNFMHVLEGPVDVVDAAYAQARQDPRNHGVITLLEKAVEERCFADWSIGFLHPEDLNEADRERARSLYSLTEASPGAAHRLMGTFRNLLPLYQRLRPEAD